MMSNKTENNSMELDKPVQVPQDDEVKFPPFPEPTHDDFEEDISEEERTHYKIKFRDLNSITTYRLHCSACDRHLGCSARNESRLRPHPMLRTLMCHTCHTFYNSGEFEKGDDGSELYCRWCGQGGQVYCCSACPHVFCAKCIKRNLGLPMIKEIEDTDDWKCFKCNSKYLWDLRAICWAVLRYCDLKNKITDKTEDPNLKEAYKLNCATDLSSCCKNKTRKKREDKSEEKKIKVKEPKEDLKKTPNTLQKAAAPSTIQVKKFASINLDEKKPEKKPQKRPASPKNKPIIIKNPLALAPKMIGPVIIPPMAKKMRISNASVINPIRFNNDRKSVNTYTRIRPRAPVPQMMYNGFSHTSTPFNHMLISDNINLSLESLTQGLDMSAVARMTNNTQENDVVCTPDFPLEPLCEVTEDNNDDDVQCIGPVITPNVQQPAPPTPPPPLPPLVPRCVNPLQSLATDNIIQMTENDVTVNAVTGGLKFRVDPQTLSSNKMYRLPDGRIFAINPNPSMPGGYSATIVAVTDDAVSKMPQKGATFAAKLSSVANQTLTLPPLKVYRNQDISKAKQKRSTPKTTKTKEKIETTTRECDMNVPVEWFRYNIIEAVDALEYSLSRLNKLKQEATTMFLRTRTVNEMRGLHKRLERLLNTSTYRFKEIRENINRELTEYISKKMGNNTSEDDDDVEILHDDHDDPIFIDENSVESTTIENQEVDLTAMGSSDHNDSSEKSFDKNDGVQNIEPSCVIGSKDSYNEDNSILPDKSIQDDCVTPDSTQKKDSLISHSEKECIATNIQESITVKEVINDTQESELLSDDAKQESVRKDINDVQESGRDCDSAVTPSSKHNQSENKDDNGDECENSTLKAVTNDNSLENKLKEDLLEDDNAGQYHEEKKIDDSDMSEEMIENLLRDTKDNIDQQNLTAMDISA